MPAYEEDERVGSIVYGLAGPLSEWLSEVKREAGCGSACLESQYLEGRGGRRGLG